MDQHDAGTEAPVCSARGCRRPAAWRITWRNPKIHDAGRRKTWLACGEHRDSLAAFLRARAFPVDVDEFTP